jgi:hypothetical protein
MSDDEAVTRILTDGGFGRRLGEYEGKTVLLGTKTNEETEEFCVVVYWNDTETDEGVVIATIDNSHGQSVHVDKYGDDGKEEKTVLSPEVSTLYEAEQYAKDNWRALAEFHFSE